MIRFFLYCVALPLLLMVFSCSQDEFAPVDLKYDYSYYPLQKGTFVIYDVREVLYPAGADSVVKIYKEMYLIGDTLNGSNTVGNNATMWTLEKYTKASANANWSFDSVWTVRYSVGKATLIVTENNIPVDKMAFPMKEGLKWNGNSQNISNTAIVTGSNTSKLADAFVLRNYRKPYSVSDTTFSNTVTVVESNSETNVSRDIRRVVYAKDIGMIYRLVQNYTYKSIGGIAIKGDIAYGRNKEWKYYSYGVKTE